MQNFARLALSPATGRLASPPASAAQPPLAPADLKTYAFTYFFRGSVVLTAALSNYALEHAGFAAPWLPWVVLMPLVGMVQSIRNRRQRQRSLLGTTATDHTMRRLQQSFLWIVLVAIAGACVFGWAVVHPLLLVLYGASTVAAGRVLHFRPLVLGGVVCGLLGAVAVAVAADTQLLLIAAAMLVSYVGPGYLLGKQSQTA